MQEVTVRLPLDKSRGYKIHVGEQAIEKIGSLFELGQYSKIVVVTDDAVRPVLLGQLTAALPQGSPSVILPAGEKYKDIKSVQKIWTVLHDAGCDRKSLLINLGGGVIGDVGGFAAATYMRGIDFLNVPTTLLAQVDASVGGKTGFNFAGIKNLAGTFTQPIGVVIDPRTLESLPEAEFLSGFGEIIKHGVIKDKDYFAKVTAKTPGEFSAEELGDIIAGSCRIKAAIVGDDETESGARKLLNFGHTVGHAVEALSLETAEPLLHGQAISIGMVAEARISQVLNMLGETDLKRLRGVLTAAGLPVSAKGFTSDDILLKMRSDKKNEGGELNFTLLDDIGQASYDQHPPEDIVTEALRTISD
jgi:3-dehydroquinate synthase